VRLDSRDIGADEALAQEAVYGVTPMSTSRTRFQNGNGSENGSAGGSGRRAQAQAFSFARGVPITIQTSQPSQHVASDAAARVVACERPYAVKRRASAVAAVASGAITGTARVAIVRSKQVAPAEPASVLDSSAAVLPVDAAPFDSVVEVDATVPRSVTLPGGALGHSSTATMDDGPRFGAAGVYAALVGAQLCWSGFHVLAKFAFLNVSLCETKNKSAVLVAAMCSLGRLLFSSYSFACCSDASNGDAHAARHRHDALVVSDLLLYRRA